MLTDSLQMSSSAPIMGCPSEKGIGGLYGVLNTSYESVENVSVKTTSATSQLPGHCIFGISGIFNSKQS